MVKKVLVLEGFRCRNGNTAELTRAATAALEARGAAVETVDLCHLENTVSGCSGCYGCQPMKFRCCLTDATAALVNRTPEFDALVFAFPIYMFGIPAQVKQFIDRMMALISYDETGRLQSKLAGKPVGCIVSSGGDESDSGLEAVRLAMKYLWDYCGAGPAAYYYRGGCSAPERIPADPAQLAEAAGFADRIMAG